MNSPCFTRMHCYLYVLACFKQSCEFSPVLWLCEQLDQYGLIWRLLHVCATRAVDFGHFVSSVSKLAKLSRQQQHILMVLLCHCHRHCLKSLSDRFCDCRLAPKMLGRLSAPVTPSRRLSRDPRSGRLFVTCASTAPLRRSLSMR